MQFSYSVFKQGEEILLAVSDIDIVGKTFAEKDLQLDVSKEFYGSKSGDEKEVIKLLKTATIVNAVGNDIISLLIREDIIERKSAIEISGVPHAQIIAFK
ncbi:MAG: DUF424 family protein [Candidatus Aenigmarchaeota archaeon]|nr:DUF424 family protein [Candidatus Aenigmarchaeota archaeon]